MCGFCGKLYYDPTRVVDAASLIDMCDAIVHRGPDEDGYFIEGPVGLGSRRLSIIDVDGGRMPLANEDSSIWVVFNGEIYNFPELRARLEQRGHRFATHTDTECIVHLYEEFGDNFVTHLQGMFAFALWDGRRRRLVLARDQMGIKPLYYAMLGDRLVFGSEIRALLRDGVPRQIDRIALHDYLSFNYVPGPRSIFTDVRKLLPGHLLVFEADTARSSIRQYWDVPKAAAVAPRRNGQPWEDRLLAVLRSVVRDQMISDVPLGAFLSGGLDSSLVVALMSEQSEQRIKTFSLGFNEASYSELPYARAVAARFGTDHHEITLEPRASDLIEAMAEHFDEPFADSSSLAVYAVSELAARHVKVVLSGDGGDEVFGGYYTYQADKLAAAYRRLPSVMTSGILPWLVDRLPVSDRKASLDFKLRRFVAGGALGPLPAHYTWKAYFSEEDKDQLYAGGGVVERVRPSVEVLQQYYDRHDVTDWLNRMLYVDMKVQLVDDMLTKVDRMSMAHSLEVRVPLLDQRLVEFMTQLPGRMKMRGLTLKFLLKRLGRRILPREVLNRPKAGFTIPVGAWIRTDLRDVVHDCLSRQRVIAQGLFDPNAIEALLRAHWRGDRNHSHNIWNLLMFSLWHERYAR